MDKKGYILLIESSAEVCSAALAKRGLLVAERNVFEKNSHSKELAPMVKDLLDEQHLKVADLSAVAISGGPGSYTGLRIGASLAKALCYSAGIPLIALSSLQLIAAEMQKQNPNKAKLCAMVDARREDVYFGLFNPDLTLIGKEEFGTLDSGFLKGQIEQVLFGGSGAAKLQNHLNLDPEQYIQLQVLASSMSQLAWDKYQNQAFEDLAYYEPNYIKAVHITSPKKNV